jgi:hypothetical protein
MDWPDYEGPYGAAQGFHRLKFADLQAGNSYVLKELEKYTDPSTGEITEQTHYSLVKITKKTATKIKYLPLFAKYGDYEPWTPIDPDESVVLGLEDSPQYDMHKNEVNGPENQGHTIMIRHFYEVGEPGNALSVASTTFSVASSAGEPEENGSAAAAAVPGSPHTIASDPYNAPPPIYPYVNQQSNYSSNGTVNSSGGRRRKYSTKRRSSRQIKLKKTIRRRCRTQRK